MKVRSNIQEIKGKRAEQLEVEFLPTPIDEMGDHLVLARWLIRNRRAFRDHGGGVVIPIRDHGQSCLRNMANGLAVAEGIADRLGVLASVEARPD